MSPSDAELLGAWAEGDTRAGSRLFNRYFLPVSRFFANKVAEDHDDLVQETFAACVRGRERLRDKSSFRAYLFAVASNVLRMYLRRLCSREPLEALDELSVHDLAPSPSTVLRGREQEHALLDALRRLPLPLQVVMELYYWEDMRTHEIAEAVELPTGTVRSHLRRGRDQLERSLRRHPPADDGSAEVVDLERWAAALRETITRSCA
ncbi:MAG: sigma-70 family RNA polymerase sigma factor [Myxococcales bacterium]|nr:sigma-70 family RNA polymerase sigma factor [Myxococcales bacterium]MCB9717076.1 sigma-70 family RNA polymerase sigma factor [Myxococcales bacterium]